MTDLSPIVSPQPDPQPTAAFLLLERGLLADGLRTLLEADDTVDVVGAASTWSEARPRLAAVRPSVVLLDADLPNGESLVCCEGLASLEAKIPVLLLAEYHQPEQMLAALSLGASGYVLKNISPRDLVEALAHLASGGALISPKAVGTLLESLRTPAPPSPLESLTQLERQVLEHLATGATNRQIARLIHISEKTVKNYISNILNKLELRNRVEAAVLITRLTTKSSLQ